MRRSLVLMVLALGSWLFVGQADAKTCNGGTSDRPVYLLNLAGGKQFCLRMPRYLANPKTDSLGTGIFSRTYYDTCGKYGLIVHPFTPAGPKGPYPHVHYSTLEYFIPLENGTLRIFIQADTAPLKTYEAGKVLGVNGLDPVSPMGHVDVPGGSVAIGVKAVPHTWRVIEDASNFVVFFVDGWGMEETINIPQMNDNLTEVLGQTAVWGTPFDLTNGMFGGPDYVTRALEHKSGLPGTTRKDMKLLQKLIEEGEACFPG